MIKRSPGLSPCKSCRRIFFSRGNFLCWHLFRYLFHPRVTAVACKRSRSFCQKCRWQVTAKHTCTLHMWLWMKWRSELVHGCMLCTELAQRRQQFRIVPAMQQPNSAAVSTPLQWIFKNTLWKATVTRDMSAVSLLKIREQCYIKNKQQNKNDQSVMNKIHIVMMSGCFWINAPHWCAWQHWKLKRRRKKEWWPSVHVQFVGSLWGVSYAAL